jgi:hypothetical protein
LDLLFLKKSSTGLFWTVSIWAVNRHDSLRASRLEADEIRRAAQDAPVLAQGEFLGKQRVDSFEGVHFAALDPAHLASRISMARGQPGFA